MRNAKYNFLKNYVKRTKTSEDKEIDHALDLLGLFYRNLPERSRGPERRKDWALLVAGLMNAFDKQIEKIASCPFVKIEIADQVETKDILTALKTYADIDFIKEEIKAEIERERHDNTKRP